MRILSFLFLSFSILTTTSAQQGFCGTPDIHSGWFTTYHDNHAQYAHLRNDEDTIDVPITVHVLGTDNGTGYHDLKTVYEALCQLNEDFVEANMRLYLDGDINYINKTEWFNHEHYSAGRDMMQSNNVSGTINCYIVANPAGNCGYFSWGGDAIALSKGCTGGTGHTWAHEVGHYLSLPHTFSGWEGENYKDFDSTPVEVGNRPVELVDGTNCNQAADRFCDTKPDYLSYRWSCGNDSLSNELQYDPQGESFRSNGTWIMSYSSGNCRGKFSQDQIDAMRANIFTQRTYLNTRIDIPEISDSAITLLTAGDTFLYDQVTLRWNSVKGAENYLVEVDNFPGFYSVNYEYVTGDTSVTLPADLLSNWKYHFRVKALNSLNYCSAEATESVFYTQRTTSTEFVDNILYEIRLLSNPVYSGLPLELNITSRDNSEAVLYIYNTAGQQLFTKEIQLFPGLNPLSLPAQHESGIYFMKVISAEGSSTLRFAVQ